jgi:hypothetical protein
MIDPNGMEIETTKKKYKTMQDGSERQLKTISFRRADRIEITHTVKSMKMYDATGKVSSEEMTQAASGIQGEISEYWNTDDYITNKKGQSLSVKTVFEKDIEVVDTQSEIDLKDHVIVVASESWMKKTFGGTGEQMTFQRGCRSILYTQQAWFNFYPRGAFAHEFGHMGGLYDILIMRGVIHQERLMYNGSPLFGYHFQVGNPMPNPHYKEFRRLNFNNQSYGKVKIGVR